jgi:hypothetical protein
MFKKKDKEEDCGCHNWASPCGCGTWNGMVAPSPAPIAPAAPAGEPIPAPKEKMPQGKTPAVGSLNPGSDVTPVATPRGGLPLEGPRNPF